MDLNAFRIFTDDVDGLVDFYATVTGISPNRIHPLFAEFPTRTGTFAVASTQTIPLLGSGAAEPRHNRSVSSTFSWRTWMRRTTRFAPESRS